MGNRKTWMIVVGVAAILEELRSFVATCWVIVRDLHEPPQVPFDFLLTGLDIALRQLISLAWIVVVLYWILHTHRAAGAEQT